MLMSLDRNSNGNTKFVLKEIPQDFNIRAGIYDRIGSHAHIRTLSDTIPARRMFVFDHFGENLLEFAERQLPLALIKWILKCALQGLAALHERDLVHKGKNTCLGLVNDRAKLIAVKTSSQTTS